MLEPEPRASGRIVRVLGEHGRPVEGALVHPLWSRHFGSRTDANGEADPGPLGGGHGTPTQFRESWTIVVRVEGYAAHMHQVPIRADAYETVTLRHRGQVIAGRCVDSSGHAVPHAELRVLLDGPDLKLQADADGRFRSEEAQPREGTLEVTSSGWIARPMRVVPPVEDLVVTLYRPAAVEVALTFDHPDAPAAQGYPGLTFRPPPHRSAFWSRRSQYTADFFPGRTLCLDGDQTLFVLDLEEGKTVRLGPMPAPPKQVRRRSPPRSPAARSPRRRRLRFDLHGLDIPEVRITGGFADGRIVDLGYIDPDEEDDDVRVPEGDLEWLGFTRTTWGRRLNGSCVGWRQPAPAGDVALVDPPRPVRVRARVPLRGGTPVPGGALGLRFAGSVSWAAALLREDGSSVLSRGVGPGRYDVVWSPGTYRGTVLLRRDVRVLAGEVAVEVPELVVPEPVELAVQVEDRQGRPIVGAVVRWRQEGRRRETALRTGDDGVARFELRDPTQLVVTAEADGYAQARMLLATFDEGGRVVLSLDDA